MSRGLNATYLSEISKQTLRPGYLVNIDTPDPVLVWSGTNNITVNSETYIGMGGLLSISSVSESSDLRETTVNMSLSGIPEDLFSASIDDLNQLAPVSIYVIFFDESGQSIHADPIEIFTGQFDQVQVVFGGGTFSITAVASDLFATLNDPNLSRYTPEDFKAKNPGNTSLDSIPGLQGKELVWGG